LQTFIALGGNLGAVEDTFRSALDELDDAPGVRVTRVSSFHRTLPMGTSSGDAYLNAAAELSVELSPLELLDLLQSLEARHGRIRESHWGPRTLDLDLLLYEQEVLRHPRLLLPHPGCWYRRFVLDPLNEIAPNVLHPVKKVTIHELQSRLLPRPLRVGLAGGSAAERTQLAEELIASFPEALVKPWSIDEQNSPALLLWLGTPKEQRLAFEDLPPLPRLDLTGFPDPPQNAASHVLSAALGS
jgi:2-amino-4-hydroxy-6-hydroxymethyldihydropteridine diphosphokinase